MFLGKRPLPLHSKPRKEKKATRKWYRAVHDKNLTERSEEK
jgi:hypothetical protein